MKTKLFTIAMLLAMATPAALADEGMWIPVLIEKYNIKLMQENGFKLTAEDIYSINRASMKDAVVLFGGGCTGEFISDKGLIITNHHCGYGYIQNHSTLEHDYRETDSGLLPMLKSLQIPDSPSPSSSIWKMSPTRFSKG